MKCIDIYNNIILEVRTIKQRIELINQYEEILSLEKKKLNELSKLQIQKIKQIKKDVNELTGIENKLYKEIVINGTNISKAIEKVAEEEDKDVSTIWKNYYPKIKYKIEQLYETKKEVENEAN